MKTAATSGAAVQFVEIPLSRDAAMVIRAVARSRILRYSSAFVLIAAVVFVGGALTVGLSGDFWFAMPIGVIAVALSVASWRIWSGAGGDIAHGIIIRATGPMTLSSWARHDVADVDLGLDRRCSLVIQGVRRKLEYSAAVSIWAHSGATKVKQRGGLFGTKEDWDFRGAAEYAPRSSIVLRISMPRDGLIWQQPGLVAPAASHDR
jgi:hypothetical protein